MQTITTLPALAAKIAECNDALSHGSDDAMRRVFAGFRMDFSADLPPDPFSVEYRDFQFRLYETIAGKPYALANERTAHITDDQRHRPWPFHTGSHETAGQHFQALGFLLRRFNLAPGARVLEFGPGWGNTTIALAQLGHAVTAVDIEPNFCALIRDRAAALGLAVEVIQGDFGHAAAVTEPYDAVLFFECFHHCADHLALLRSLHHAVKPGAPVFFAAEPILLGYPIPWGLRGDGEALWAIRNFGWLELGFDEAYFREALARTGWHAHRHPCPDPDWAAVWEARALPPAAPSESDRLAVELAGVYRSTSWRLTAPLRAFGRLISTRK